MRALALLLRMSSSVWKKIRRTLNGVAAAVVESRMRRVQIEIDRYHRTHALISPSDNDSV